MSNVVTGVNDPYFTVRVAGTAPNANFVLSVTARNDTQIDTDLLYPEQIALLDAIMLTIVQAIEDRSDVYDAQATRYETQATIIDVS